MTFRYIGSKARVVEAIASSIGSPNGTGRFVDLFCGTGVVAETAASLGWKVHLNDHLHSAVIMAGARIIGLEQAQFSRLGGYAQALKKLNNIAPRKGFVWREYSPASARTIGFERRYFTEENAARIDSIRKQIGTWTAHGLIDANEERVLIADLLSATNRVANIAGTYGCFLSKWQSQANYRLALRPREFKEQSTDVTTSVKDAAHVAVMADDLVYLDPPYTKRQYASYYHLLETISLGDEPVVEGVSGLRPWKDKASDYCYKTRALDALSNLVRNLDADRVLLSYSEDGHVPIGALTEQMTAIGQVNPIRLMAIGRYRPNKVASERTDLVGEYLIEITRKQLRAAA